MKYTDRTVASIHFILKNGKAFQLEEDQWKSDVFVKLSEERDIAGNAFSLDTHATKGEQRVVKQRRYRLINLIKAENMFLGDSETVMCTSLNEATGTKVEKELISSSNSKTVAFNAHKNIGCLGIDKLLACFHQKYVRIGKDDAIYVRKNCPECLLKNPSTGKVIHNNPIQIYTPFKRVGVDFSDFSDGVTSYRMLTVIDYFSRFGWAFVAKDSTAIETAKTLRELFLTLGRIPEELQCDNGAQFCSDILENLMRVLGVSIKRSLPYSPETGGRFERFHATLKSNIGSIMRANGELTFKESLESALFMYNNTPHSSLSFKGKTLSPIEVWQAGPIDRSRPTNVMGRKSNVPCVVDTVTTQAPDFDEQVWSSINDIAYNTGSTSTQAVMRAESRITHQAINKQTPLAEGDIGLVKIPKKNRRAGQPLNVPCIITKVLSDFAVKVSLLDKDFQEVIGEITTPVATAKFHPVNKEKGNKSGATSNVAAAGEIRNKQRITAEKEGALYHSLGSYKSALAKVGSHAKIPDEVEQWVKSILLKTGSDAVLILEILTYVCELTLESHCQRTEDRVRSMCDPVPKDHPAIFQALWPYVKSKRILSLVTVQTSCNAPASTSDFPVSTRNAQASSSIAPVRPSNVQANTSDATVDKNSAKASTNEATLITANEQATSRTPPVRPSNVQANTSEATVDKNSAKASTNEATLITANEQATSRTPPVRPSNVQANTSEATVDKNSAQASTNEAPLGTTNVQATSSKPPVCTSNAQTDTTEAPLRTNSPQARTNEAPVSINTQVTSSKASVSTSIGPASTSDAKSFTGEVFPTSCSRPDESRCLSEGDVEGNAAADVPKKAVKFLYTGVVPKKKTTCKCTKACTSMRCKCRRNKEICTVNCGCKGDCVTRKPSVTFSGAKDLPLASDGPLLVQCHCRGRAPCKSKACSCNRVQHTCGPQCACFTRKCYQHVHPEYKPLKEVTPVRCIPAVTSGEAVRDNAPANPGISQFAQNCYLNAVLMCLRGLDWWHEIVQHHEDVQLVKHVISLIRVNDIHVKKGEKQGPEFTELHAALSMLLTYMNWDNGRAGFGNANDAAEFYEAFIDRLLQDLEQKSSTAKTWLLARVCFPAAHATGVTDVTGSQAVLRLAVETESSSGGTFDLLEALQGTRNVADNANDSSTSSDYVTLQLCNISRRKIAIDVPMGFDASMLQTSDSGSYALRAAVLYDENSSHFKSLVREKHGNEFIWIRYDGSFNESVSESCMEIELERKAYMLFYSRTAPSSTTDHTYCVTPKKPLNQIDLTVTPPTISFRSSDDTKELADLSTKCSTPYSRKLDLDVSKAPSSVSRKDVREYDVDDTAFQRPPKRKRLRRVVIDKNPLEVTKRIPRENTEENTYDGVRAEEFELMTALADAVTDSDTIDHITWESIVGHENAKRAIQQTLIWPLKSPHLFAGITETKGYLFYGPPGTGKTLLAKAVANEVNSTFINVSSRHLTSKWIGESSKNISLLFKLARNRAPSIIFIDEIDSICGKRSEAKGAGSQHDHQVLTQILQEMDGFNTLNNVQVIGATNVPWNIEEAVLRRFARHIYIPLPTVDVIQEHIARHIEDACELNIAELAQSLKGCSGSDVKHICTNALLEAATDAMQANAAVRPPVNASHFNVAMRNIKPAATEEYIKKYDDWARYHR